jgi:hypothetical protein
VEPKAQAQRKEAAERTAETVTRAQPIACTIWAALRIAMRHSLSSTSSCGKIRGPKFGKNGGNTCCPSFYSSTSLIEFLVGQS